MKKNILIIYIRIAFFIHLEIGMSGIFLKNRKILAKIY